MTDKQLAAMAAAPSAQRLPEADMPRASNAQAAPDGLFDALGAAAGRWSPSSRAGLTMRQLVVLSLVAQGQPNKRIATELGIAERTVKLHVTALLEKLCARNRTHLLVVAREQGIL
jgi:DNA-binding NarL/FixJ family response regulator